MPPRLKGRESYEKNHVTPFTLKTKRGWTQAAIARFLGEADGSYKAEHPYKKWAMMTIQVYKLERVTWAEATEEFRDWLERRKATAAARAAGAAKRKATVAAKYTTLK